MSRKLYLLGWIFGLSLSVVPCSCGGGPGSGSATASPVEEARALAVGGDLDAALEVLEAERAKSGLTPELGLLLGGVHEGRGNESAAVAIYRKTADEFPGSGAVELRLANIFLNLNQTEASLQRLKKARAAGESDADVALTMAVAYGLLGQFAEATAELDLAEKSGVAPATVKYNRGLLLRQTGDKAGSRDVLHEAYEATPEDPSILRELARAELLLADGQDLEGITRAEEFINQSISLVEANGGSDWRGYEVLGDCFSARGDFAAASEMFLKAKEIGQEPHPRLDDKYYAAQLRVRAELSGENE